MCGRYYVDDETAREIEKIACNLDRRLQISNKRDIYPSQKALIMRGDNHDKICAEQMVWGLPKYDNKGLLINARAESALEKRAFKDSVQQRRCVIPAKGFYEWNKNKEKFNFERKDSAVVFMAGYFDFSEGQERFVIFTTEANLSVSPIHERMPLILEREEIERWLFDWNIAKNLLHKTPINLTYATEYEQINLF